MKTTLRTTLLAYLLTSPLTANADWSVFGGVDVIHDQGAKYAELRYHDKWTDNFGWSGYIGTNQSIGLGFEYETENWLFGFGYESREETKDVVETDFAYDLRVEYKLTKQWNLAVVHRSNCRDVCTTLPLEFLPHGDEDKENRGLNYIGLRYNF